MKSTLFNISAILLLSASQMQAQWHLTQASPNHMISDLQVWGEDTLLANSSKSGPILLRSTDGGTTLDTVAFPDFSRIKTHFVSTQTGFVLGLNAVAFTDKVKVMKTTDGGSNWEYTNFNWSEYPYHFHIHFIDGTKGFVSTGDTLHRTSDGGNTFSTQRLIADPHYISNIHFLNAQTGFVTLVRMQTDGETYRDMIFKTTNGGDTWTQVYSELPKQQILFVYPGISKMQFVNNQLGYAVSAGVPATLFKTTDGGNNWDSLSVNFLPDHFDLRDVHFINEQVGYLAADAVYKTIDGGQSWTAQSLHPQGDYGLESLQMVNENLGYLGGHGIFKTTAGGGSLNIKSSKKSDLGIKLYPNPSSGTVFIDKPEDVTIEGIQIIDALGRRLKTIKGAASKVATDQFAKGNYWMLMQTNKGIASTQFVIQ